MLTFCAPSCGGELIYKEQLLRELIKRVPQILEQYDCESGRFGQGIWIVNDQHKMYPLAVVYKTKADVNPYYNDASLLEVIMKAGDALVEDMDEQGRWEFRKKDGSTWGPIHMPWTYSRWIRTFGLIRDDMPSAQRKVWENALTLGYNGIAKTQLKRVHNIPTHHAMGLYIAGKVLERPQWCSQAAEFMMKVVSEQAQGGYWSEGSGPVVNYNFVYIDALGTYYAITEDERVLPALEKATHFHWYFTYPNGDNVETVDERNPYHRRINPGNVGFTFTPVGRTWLQRQWKQYGLSRLSSDLIASLLLYGRESAVVEELLKKSYKDFVLTEDNKKQAAIVRSGPWFVCFSAYSAPVNKSRWIQDRQNLVSVFHDSVGLILGGGNTKLQPAWSNFTVGDMTLLKHKAGDTNPDFVPKGKLYHVPTNATLLQSPDYGLELKYGVETCKISIRIRNNRILDYRIEATVNSGLPVMAHLAVIPHLGESLETAGGMCVKLDETPLEWSAGELGGSLSHAGYRIYLPDSATLHWPALPHNPYRKDGHAEAKEGRIEIRIPFDAKHTAYSIRLEVIK